MEYLSHSLHSDMNSSRLHLRENLFLKDAGSYSLVPI